MSAPYVGPFPLDGAHDIYGRSTEITAVFNEFVANRVMLLHAPSGAGKTSLIEAGLRPLLERYDFDVHRPIRPGHEPPREVRANRYLYSTLSGLRAPIERGCDGPALRAHLKSIEAARPDRSQVLIFDQFEELFNRDPDDIDAKEDFLAELGEIFEDHPWWVLFSMRQEYVGELDAMADVLPTGLESRFRLGLLRHPAALEAIVEPARRPPKLGDGLAYESRPFTDNAATLLLSALTENADGHTDPFVDPLLLQVVCLRVWQQTEGHDRIKAKDIRQKHAETNIVETALRDYYNKEVCRAAQRSLGRPSPARRRPRRGSDDPCTEIDKERPPELRAVERKVRTWFTTELIDAGNRKVTTILPEVDGAERVLEYLRDDAHLVRDEPRAGATLYELAHDRLVPIIERGNASWEGVHLTPFQSSAKVWKELGSKAVLITGWDLRQVRSTLDPDQLEQHEREFLEACEQEDERLEKRARLRTAAIIGTAIAALAMVVTIYLLGQANQRAERNEAEARAARLAGESRAADDPNLALVLAIEADAASEDSVDARSALYQATSGRMLGVLDAETGAGTRAMTTDGAGRLVVVGDGRAVESYAIDDGLGAETTGSFTVGAAAGDEPATTDPDAVRAVSIGDGAVAAITGDRLVLAADDGEVSEVRLPANAVDVVMAGAAAGVLLDSGTVHIASGGTARAVELGSTATAITTDDGRWYVGTENGSVLALDSATAAPRPVLESDDPERASAIAALAADGSSLAVATDAGAVAFVDLESPGPIDLTAAESTAVLATTPGTPETMVYTSSDLVAAGYASGLIRVFDPRSGGSAFSLNPATGTVPSIAALSGDRLVVGIPDARLMVWDVAPAHLPGQATGIVATSPSSVVTSGTDGSLLSWTLDGRRLVRPSPVAASADGVGALARRADGLIAAAAGASVLFVEGDAVEAVDAGGPVSAVAFRPDGSLLVGFDDGRLGVLSDEGVPVASTMATSGVAIVGLAVFDETAVALDEDGTMVAWNGDPSQPEPVEVTLDRFVSTIAAHRGELLLVDADGFGFLVEVGPLRAGTVAEVAPIGPGLAAGVAAVSDGFGRVAVAFADGTAEVWLVPVAVDDEAPEDPQLVARIPLGEPLLDLAFVAGGDALATTMAEGRVIVHPLDQSELRASAEGRVRRPPEPRECERFDLGLEWCDG